MLATSNLHASCFKNNQKDLQNALVIGPDTLTRLNRHTTGSGWVSHCRIALLPAKTVPGRILVFQSYISLSATLDLEDDPQDRRTRQLEFRVIESQINDIHWAGIKLQAPDALSRLPTTRNDEMRLNNNVPVLKISDKATPKERS